MVNFMMYASRYARVALSFLLPSLLVAQSAEADEPSFYEEVGRPVTLSVHQEFPGFSEHLAALDKSTGLLAKGTEWFSFWDADIWVYFIEDPNEVENISGIPQYVYEEAGEMDRDIYSKRVTINLGERPVMIVFYNLSPEAQIDGNHACRSATMLYHAVAGFEEQQVVVDAVAKCAETQ